MKLEVGTKSRLYNIWANMKQRCLDPKSNSFKKYGGRGISVCNDWIKYSNFKNWALNSGYQDNLTIDRINNNQALMLTQKKR